MKGSTFLRKCCRKLLSMPSTDSVSHQDLVVCTCGQQEYTARDVIDAAIFRGEFEDKWQKFLCHLAAEERADELELELDESAISAGAEEFRYQHDLITAEETEAWLANRGLTLDDFSDYFARQYCASAVPEGFCPEEVGYNSAHSELRELFVAELILSGELEEMTTKLMWRLAAHCAGTEMTPDAVAAEERSFFERNAISRTQLGEWLGRLGRDEEWFNEMLVLEATYRSCCETLLVPQARHRELAMLRMPLTRLETEVIELESHDAAREALFCIREDGMSMEEVAAEGRYPYRRVDFVLEDIATEAQQKFLSVSAGGFLEPVARADGFELCRIISKIEPEADDPMVKSRIDRRLLDRHFAELASRYVEQRLGGVSSSTK
jgi:hypothetical protein